MSDPEHGTPANEREMYRDIRDVWPERERVPGMFDISPCSLRGRAVNARIEFICPNGKHCSVFMGPASEPRPTEDAPHVWGWDGNIERPTLTPSINCIAEKVVDGKTVKTGGCGWHGFITHGVMK